VKERVTDAAMDLIRVFRSHFQFHRKRESRLALGRPHFDLPLGSKQTRLRCFERLKKI
jgi:hypothetical protein